MPDTEVVSIEEEREKLSPLTLMKRRVKWLKSNQCYVRSNLEILLKAVLDDQLFTWEELNTSPADLFEAIYPHLRWWDRHDHGITRREVTKHAKRAGYDLSLLHENNKVPRKHARA